MNISEECSQAGLILFAKDAWINFTLNEHLTPTRLMNAVNQITYNEISHNHCTNGTNTPAALDLLRTAAKNGTLGLSDDKIHIAVFITDGKTYLTHKNGCTTERIADQEHNDQITKSAGNRLHEARIYDQIYAIGINENRNTLSYVANSTSRIFSLAKFNEILFNQLTINISKVLCDSELSTYVTS